MKHFPGHHTWITVSEKTGQWRGWLRIGRVRVEVVMTPQTRKQQECKCGKARIVVVDA